LQHSIVVTGAQDFLIPPLSFPAVSSCCAWEWRGDVPLDRTAGFPPAEEAGRMNERRRFLTKAGKIALATPPALAMLMSTKGRAYAGATSGHYSGGGGGGSNYDGGYIKKILGWFFGRH
jgi:hypothetical protein